MKKQISTLAITLITAISTWAYDFKVGELCYNITNYNEVEVTYEQTLDSWNEVPTYSSLSGSINIPREVNYNGSNYTVTNIGSFSFSYCTSITEIILPNSINNIEMNAFYKCTGLTEIILPNSVTNIGSSAFYGCSSLTEITIPNSVTSIEDNAFNNCSVLNAIYYLGQIEEWCNINFESDNSNPLFLAHNLYINNTLITEVTIPEGITEIKNYTFIGSSSLKQITLPNNLTHIGNETFRNCSALEQVSLPNSITSIGEKAFRNCSNLTQIILPSNITNIGLGAFQMSLALTSVYCEAITPPTLGDYAFADVRGTDPNTKEYYSIKIDLSKATNLKTIGLYAFNSYYINIDDFVIPEKVDTIGGSAFYDTVKVLHMRPQTPPICGHYRYEYWDGHLQYFGTPLYCDTIYVPKGCKDVYLKGACEGKE